jgi:hypothetical protein
VDDGVEPRDVGRLLDRKFAGARRGISGKRDDFVAALAGESRDMRADEAARSGKADALRAGW